MIIFITSCRSQHSLSYRIFDKEHINVPVGFKDSLNQLNLIYNKQIFSTKDTNICKKKILNQKIIDFIQLNCSYTSLNEDIYYLGNINYNNNFYSSLFLKSLIIENDINKEIYIVNYKDSLLLSTILLSYESSGGWFGGYSINYALLKKNKVFKIKSCNHVSDVISPFSIEDVFIKKCKTCKFILTNEGYVKEVN